MELYYIIAITDHDRGEAMGSLVAVPRAGMLKMRCSPAAW